MARSVRNGSGRKIDENAVQATHALLSQAGEEIFELSKCAWLSRRRRHRGGSLDLTESEFLTLDLVARERSQTVGQLRKSLGVLPAQMSRILRSLERPGNKPLVRCTFNLADRRRIDVTITEAGRTALKACRDAKTSMTAEALAQLPARDVCVLIHYIEKMRGLCSRIRFIASD
jgi:DNA-binding MarR family transcriptional regulator